MLLAYTTAEQRRAYGLRRHDGEMVTLQGDAYAGKRFWVFSIEVAGNKAGVAALPVGTFGVFVAAAKPREFSFSALDFAPYTNVPPPTEGNVIERMGLLYLVTDGDRRNRWPNTLDVRMIAYCWIDRELEAV